MSQLLYKYNYTITIAGAIITKEVLDCDIKIEMNTSFEPDIFKIRLFNVDQITQTFLNKNTIITIEIGYDSGIKSKIMTGVITNVYNEDTQAEYVTVIEGIDQTIYNLKKTKINISINNTKDVIDIIREICLKAGVIISPDTKNSGYILENYTINNAYAYDVIKELAERIKYNVTAKNSLLHVTKTIAGSSISATINDELGYNVRKMESIAQNSVDKTAGYEFNGVGIPTLVPLKLITFGLNTLAIFGTYTIESVIHVCNSKSGYMSYGICIESNTDSDSVTTIQFPSVKTFATLIADKMASFFKRKIAIDTGRVEQLYSDIRLVTAKIGINSDKVRSIVTPSVEAEIGENNVFVIKKPLSSIFAGNGYGLIVPVYQDMRAVIGFNRYDMQDANILGFLWKKGWTIPSHDVGDYMLHHKNHSKFVMKEDGSQIEQVKSLRIQIGNDGLVVTKPTATGDGELLIEFDDGSKLQYDSNKWILNTSGSVEIGANATSVKLAGGGKKVSRLGDNVGIDATLLSWLNTHIHIDPLSGTTGTPSVIFTGSNAGQIAQSSLKTEVD